MNNDLASMRPMLTFEIDTVLIKMPPPSLANLVEVQRWLNLQPSPRERVRKLLEDLPPGTPAEVQARIATEAVERSAHWPPKFGTMEANMLLTEMEGVIQLAASMIRTGQPMVTLDRAIELAGKLPPTSLTSIMEAAFGEEEEPEADPKAPPAD